jgi:putative addiction module killer protein
MPEYGDGVWTAPEYRKWREGLRDQQTAAKIDMRVRRLVEGNRGKGRFLKKVCELKIDWGPGYRVYYADTGEELILLLCGGDKSSQQEDIKQARRIAARYIKGAKHDGG